MVFVDLVLGPGLTLIVFKPGKPSLKMDMTVILLIQLSALSWGVYNAWSVHPKMTVYFDSQVYCLDQQEVKDAHADPGFSQTPLQASITAILPYPETNEEKHKYLTTGEGGVHMAYRLGEFYQKMTRDLSSQLDENQFDIKGIISDNSHFQQQWQQFVERYDSINPDWRYYPFHCLQDSKTLVLDRKTNHVEAVLDIDIPVEKVLNH